MQNHGKPCFVMKEKLQALKGKIRNCSKEVFRVLDLEVNNAMVKNVEEF